MGENSVQGFIETSRADNLTIQGALRRLQLLMLISPKCGVFRPIKAVIAKMKPKSF
jgi:hypothetical protein